MQSSAVVTTEVRPRDVDTDYWIEYGTSAPYTLSSAHQTITAGQLSGQQELSFTLGQLEPGTTYHFRMAAQSLPGGTSYDERLPDVFQFRTSTGYVSPKWDFCGSDTETQCVRSLTVDGGPAPAGFRPDVFQTGEVVQLGVFTERGGQDLLYAGSPLTAASLVTLVVNVGTFDPAAFAGNGRLTDARVDHTEGGNIITFAGTPQRVSYRRAGCDNGSCDDTSQADSDFAGRMSGGAFTSFSSDPAYQAASRGMWISSNAQGTAGPLYDAATGAISVTLTAPHLTATGALNDGYFRAFVPTALVTDLWRIESPDRLTTTVATDSGIQPATVTWTAATGGWLMSISDFHYSSPTIRMTPPLRPLATPRVSLGQSVINAGQRVSVSYRGTPNTELSIWSKTQPASTYTHIGTVRLDANGLGTSSHAPRRNTRIMAKTLRGQASSQPLIQVRSIASIGVRRVATRTYTFTGTISPALAGRVVTLYRNGIGVAQSRTSSTGVYAITKTLPRGLATFVTRTASDSYNLGATSRSLQATVF